MTVRGQFQNPAGRQPQRGRIFQYQRRAHEAMARTQIEAVIMRRIAGRENLGTSRPLRGSRGARKPRQSQRPPGATARRRKVMISTSRSSVWP
jgi:hypothetical protein